MDTLEEALNNLRDNHDILQQVPDYLTSNFSLLCVHSRSNIFYFDFDFGRFFWYATVLKGTGTAFSLKRENNYFFSFFKLNVANGAYIFRTYA